MALAVKLIAPPSHTGGMFPAVGAEGIGLTVMGIILLGEGLPEAQGDMFDVTETLTVCPF